MGIVSFILLGLIAGAIAKAVWKGDEPGRLTGTLVVGASSSPSPRPSTSMLHP